jgi:hypothetical protein
MGLTKTKCVFESLTINASMIRSAAAILGAFGIHIAPQALPELEHIVEGILAAIAIYRRIRAKEFIS